MTPFQVIDKFLDVTAEMEDGESLQYFQQRSSMMVNIVRRMKAEMVQGGLSSAEAGAGWGGSARDSLSLEAEFSVLWAETWRRGRYSQCPLLSSPNTPLYRLDILGTKQCARLLQIGGPEWLVMAKQYCSLHTTFIAPH